MNELRPREIIVPKASQMYIIGMDFKYENDVILHTICYTTEYM